MHRLLALALAAACAAPSAWAQTPAPADCTGGWAAGQRFTLVTDSVLLGAYKDLRAEMRAWRIRMRGKVALTVRSAERDLRRRNRRVAPLVVVGLGYNSNWQRNRENYDFWARHFDRDSERLVRTLRRLGARQIVWVNLREPTRAMVPPEWHKQWVNHAWYFPYVNERLEGIDRRHGDVVLADWARAARRRGITHDAIHLNRAGAALMARTIQRAVREEARRQVSACSAFVV